MIRKLRQYRLSPEIRRRSEAYAAPIDAAKRRLAQLAAWNAEWRQITRQVPYYARLQSELSLPEGFQSWEEFTQLMPVTTRAGVQQYTEAMRSHSRKADFYRVTGGSTAQPVQLPAWNSELHYCRPDIWLARRWYGIQPGDRLFMIWGHAHLFGNGLPGWFRARKRELSDRLLGYYRFSAYHLSPETMQNAARAMLRVRPDYIVGYSVALDRFARSNLHLKNQLRALGVKVIVGTAESFPAPDSERMLEELFGCPVAMEYGAVETGLISHTAPRSGHQVFWRSYFVEAERENSHAGGLRVRITSLYPRCFPLVRYDIGDEVEPCDPELSRALSLEKFKRVIGRCNDYVILADGSRIHSETFSHAVRSCPEITGYQVVQTGSEISIRLTTHKALPEKQIEEIRMRLNQVHPQLKQIKIEKIDCLPQTTSGKTRMVVRE